jgi:predicted TIM-barrel fold metal-dependent hydrolase
MMAAGLEGDAASGHAGAGATPGSAMRLAMQTEAQIAETQAVDARARDAISLLHFQPRSMLHVAETPIEKPRFPVIDIHTHLSWSARDRENGEGVRFSAAPADLLPVMDRRGLRVMVNLTGGVGRGLQQTLARFDTAHPGRFVSFTEPWWGRASEPDYPRWQAAQIEAAHAAGARGLKVLKTLGLYLRDGGPQGPLVKIDDPRFDPMWDACGALGMPVAIHVSDPEAFFLPIDRFNERYEELHNHPDWSFHGRDFPSHRDLMAACDRVFARHPKTTFIALHVGHNAENLGFVSERLEQFPNMMVDLAARVGELGRQPRAARKFFERFQDRILFGTDAVPEGKETPQQIFGDELYRIYYRFLETDDEYFDYAPAAVPPQGRWRIYGVDLPDEILKKVYGANAARLLKITL